MSGIAEAPVESELRMLLKIGIQVGWAMAEQLALGLELMVYLQPCLEAYFLVVDIVGVDHFPHFLLVG